MKRFVCSHCGAELDKPRKKDRGAGGCLLMGLLFLVTLPTVIIPIIIVVLDYVWYRSSIKNGCCPICGGEGCVIPTDTPMGRKLVAETKPKAAKTPATKTAKVGIVYNPKTHQYEKV